MRFRLDFIFGDVGMIAASQRAISALDLGFRRVALDPEDCIIVSRHVSLLYYLI
jgi:hypothetical protein